VIGSDGAFKERPLSTLSGGQWRRCSLALTFAFAELVARRGKLRPSICVLDEPLTHLDRSGRAKVGEVIRGMLRPPDSAEFRGFGGLGMTTVLIILQDLAAEELDEAFDCIDEVVKEKSSSYVKVDELT
jgi:DNA repair exonuclease SbcCD ATPase subunit